MDGIMSDPFKLVIQFNISSTAGKKCALVIVCDSPQFATKRDTLYDAIKPLSWFKCILLKSPLTVFCYSNLFFKSWK